MPPKNSLQKLEYLHTRHIFPTKTTGPPPDSLLNFVGVSYPAKFLRTQKQKKKKKAPYVVGLSV